MAMDDVFVGDVFVMGGCYRWRSVDDHDISVSGGKSVAQSAVSAAQDVVQIGDGKRRLDLDGKTEVAAPVDVGRNLDFV